MADEDSAAVGLDVAALYGGADDHTRAAAWRIWIAVRRVLYPDERASPHRWFVRGGASGFGS